jgi:hypothetical protein
MCYVLRLICHLQMLMRDPLMYRVLHRHHHRTKRLEDLSYV